MNKKFILNKFFVLILMASLCSKRADAAEVKGMGKTMMPVEEEAFIEDMGQTIIPVAPALSIGLSYLAMRTKSPILAIMGLGALATTGLFGAVYKEIIDDQAAIQRRFFESNVRNKLLQPVVFNTHTLEPGKKTYLKGAAMTGSLGLSNLVFSYITRNQNSPTVATLQGIAALGSLAVAGFFGNEYRKIVTEEAKRIEEVVVEKTRRFLADKQNVKSARPRK